MGVAFVVGSTIGLWLTTPKLGGHYIEIPEVMEFQCLGAVLPASLSIYRSSVIVEGMVAFALLFLAAMIPAFLLRLRYKKGIARPVLVSCLAVLWVAGVYLIHTFYAPILEDIGITTMSWFHAAIVASYFTLAPKVDGKKEVG